MGQGHCRFHRMLVSRAELIFEVATNNSSTPSVAMFEVLQDWDESATGLTYDGVNNWSSVGAQGALDQAEWSYIEYDVSDDDYRWISPQQTSGDCTW